MATVTLLPAEGPLSRRRFLGLPARWHREEPAFRATEDDLIALLCFGRSVFRSRADVLPFLVRVEGRITGRLALIRDHLAPERVLVGWFDALPETPPVLEVVREEARRRFPGARTVVAGLCGHLNYAAGFLLNRFDQPPVFGLPWNPPHLPDHFRSLGRVHRMVSYRFPNLPFYEMARAFAPTFDPGAYRVRPLDKGRLRRDAAIYTGLNNACFQGHPFWTDRRVEEDFELFHPFRFLIRPENLLFVEHRGEPVGFLLWYPDFNELVGPGRRLGMTSVARYRLANPIRTVRLTEIGVRPDHRGGPATAALVLAMIQAVERGPYTECEGGFIFEENQGSLGMTLKFLSRAFGKPLEPYREYAVFEGPL